MTYYDPFDDFEPSEEKKKKRYLTIKLEFDRKHDADLIDILQSKKDMASYIKNLIRKDLKNGNT